MQESNLFSEPRLIQYLETRTSRGMLSKGWYEHKGKLLLVKGNGDIGGYEPQSEVLVSNLLDILGIPHVKYWLEPASKYPQIKTFNKNDYVSVCESYLTDDMISVATFYNYNAAVNQSLRPRDMWSDLLSHSAPIVQDTCQMLHIDAIVGNQDRHLNNWDIVKYRNGEVKVAPMFDFGASLLAWEDIKYSDFSRGISPDKAKPFRELHSKQIQLISRVYSQELYRPTLMLEWEEISESTLQTLGSKRATAVINSLRNRLEVYVDV